MGLMSDPYPVMEAFHRDATVESRLGILGLMQIHILSWIGVCYHDPTVVLGGLDSLSLAHAMVETTASRS